MNNNMLRNFVILLSLIILVDLFLNIYLDSNILNVSFPYLSPSNGWEQRGQWGDMLSGHFSALAFLAVAYSVYLQIVFNKQQRNLDSFKMAIALIENLKNEAILMTSRTNTPLIEIKIATFGDIINHNTNNIIKRYSQSFHDILLAESLFESIFMLSQDLNTKQQDIISLKTRLVRSDYQTIAELYFWCTIAIHFESCKINNSFHEESKTKRLLENMAFELIESSRTNNDYLSVENIKKYQDKIRDNLSKIFNIENRKPSLLIQIRQCYRKLKILCKKRFRLKCG
jgi:hypothetical protein